MNLKTLILSVLTILWTFNSPKKPVRVFLAGDSTVADYSLEADYQQKRFPLVGWGQVFQQFFVKDSLAQIKGLIKSDSVLVVDKARGGRSTRTFFEEGRWSEIYQSLQKDDIVMIQFGHNDSASDRPERYVNIAGYKEYLRLFVNQARSKRAIPILITPVNRNYPWTDGKLANVHGEYPNAVKEVASELKVKLIDLTQLSIDAFVAKGKDYVTKRYFMNFEKGEYPAYPDGQKDNTHFQKEGGMAIAQLVFNEMKKM